MKKKLLSLLLAATMVLGLAACGDKDTGNSGNGGNAGGDGQQTTVTKETEKEINGHKYTINPNLTDEKITLTYFHFDQDETVQYLANRFMEVYPNITVNAVYENVSTYMDTLIALVANGDAPDVMMYSDADAALSNMLLMDISEYYNADPETKNLADTVNSAGLGTFQTKGRYAVPVKFFPGIMFIDRNVLETLNVPVPSQNWTWAEMIKLIKDCTVLDSPDGMAYYGIGVYNRLDSYYGIAASQEIIGEFGYNGDEFDLSVWAVGEQEFADLAVGGYRAPAVETEENEEWTGDWEKWFGNTGHVALFSEAYWTYMSSWATGAQEEYNMDVVPYVVPAVNAADANSSHHSIATIDFGGVVNGCKYPAEAYELLKFMSFGVDGWTTRLELYNDESKTNASGQPLKYDVMPAPITKNQDVWEGYIKMYTKGMDEEHVQAWRNYFASCMQPIAYGWTSIAGYWNYCDGYFNKIGIHNLVDKGTNKAADFQVEATEQANWYHAVAMLDYFGPDGYDVLSAEEVAHYKDMVAKYGK